MGEGKEYDQLRQVAASCLVLTVSQCMLQYLSGYRAHQAAPSILLPKRHESDFYALPRSHQTRVDSLIIMIHSDRHMPRIKYAPVTPLGGIEAL